MKNRKSKTFLILPFSLPGLNIIGNNVSSSVGCLSVSNAGANVGGPLSPGSTTLLGPPPTILSSGGSLILGGGGGGNSPTAVHHHHHHFPQPTSPQPAVGSVTTTGTTPELHHQLLTSHQPHHHSAAFVEVEFNLWTRPDCAGTPYENQNRTWFYFAVTGWLRFMCGNGESTEMYL